MGTKDVCEKHLISLNDVFAEVWNFRSKVRIHPEALYEAPTEHITHAKHEYVHKYRDIFKYYRNELKLNIAVLGVENQTKPEKAMPARVMTYDALFYEDQFRHMRSGVKLIPVFTKVLYFGYHKRWTEPRSLSEQCRVPIEFADQFQDYRIEVVELAWLTDEEIDSLSGDLKVAAIFLRKLRLNEISEWPRLKIQHIDELLNLFTEITKQSEFQRMKSECAERKGEIMMCDVFENYKKDLISQGMTIGEERGEKRGIQIGEERGEKIGELNQLLVMTKRIMGKMGSTLEESMRYLQLTEAEKNLIRGAVGA